MIATEETVTQRRPALDWVRITFAMFAVGWGANQFSPMLIVYRHELNLSAAAVAGLFAIYAATLVPGLLIGGPASDKYGRRPVVLPFVALSPIATLLLIAAPRDLAVLAASRALAGLCSGVVFSSATAWVQELSMGTGARRAALALSAGFGLGPIVAAFLAQWAPDPLRVPYLPHLAIGIAAAAVVLAAPDVRAQGERRPRAARSWPPRVVRTWPFWLAVAPAAPLVFGTVSIAIVVLPEDVTSAKSLSAAFAGVMTVLTFSGGIGIQPLARRLAPGTGLLAGVCSATIGTAVGVVAVHAASRPLAGAAAVFLGLSYGLCLVSGLRQAEQLAGESDRGAVVACYYALAYVGFAAPYLVAGLGALSGKAGALAILAVAAAVLTAWTLAYSLISRRRAS
jgi:predicted MFS family arabinose efflux permease